MFNKEITIEKYVLIIIKKNTWNNITSHYQN